MAKGHLVCLCYFLFFINYIIFLHCITSSATVSPVFLAASGLWVFLAGFLGFLREVWVCLFFARRCRLVTVHGCETLQCRVSMFSVGCDCGCWFAAVRLLLQFGCCACSCWWRWLSGLFICLFLCLIVCIVLYYQWLWWLQTFDLISKWLI